MKSSGSIALLSLLILSMILVLPSCRDEDFRVTGAQLKGVASYRLCDDGSLEMAGEYLVLSMTIPADDSYAFHLEDADGLVWEGDLSGEDGVYSSDELTVSSTANLLEVRGVGLIDVEAMYGVGGVLNQKRIHLVIEMEKWDDNKSYDRLGDEALTYDILGVKFQRIVVPVSAGRNLAVVIEAASRNFRLKSMGRDALDELSLRLMEKNRPREIDN